MEVLLDQQDRRRLRAFSSRKASIMLLHDRRREALGRLVDRGAARAARRWRARSPASASARPRACRPGRFQNLFSAGKRPKIQSSRVCVERPAARGEHHVLAHREVGEDRPWSPAHRRCRARAMSGVAGLRDVAAVEADAAGGGLPQAHDGAQRRGLAGAVAAEQHRQLARAAPRSRRRAGCGSGRYACARRRAAGGAQSCGVLRRPR